MAALFSQVQVRDSVDLHWCRLCSDSLPPLRVLSSQQGVLRRCGWEWAWRGIGKQIQGTSSLEDDGGP